MSITTGTPSTASSTGHTFVSYARDDSSFAMQVAEGLRARDVPIWIDQWNIDPGANWSRSLDAALSACASFLIILSPDAVASDEVQGELRFALNARKPIVPLLFRPCEIPRPLLLRQYVDFTQSTDVSGASLDRLARALRDGRADVFPPSTHDRSNRLTLLQDVKDEAVERLGSIGADTPAPILLEAQPHQVARPWDDEALPQARHRPAPPVTRIMEVFDEESIRGSLLILGAPGSGKTTMLLQLMKQLASRAELDDGQPIPVLVSLASWRVGRTIGDWLVAQLKMKYGVRADLGVQWRDSRSIVPLLDGLDELPAEQHGRCVEAINEFQQSYEPPRLVVCCRQAEYENLAVKLRLRGAVAVLPLEPDQIRAWLEESGSSDLWTAIRDDPALMEMARSPLLLSFMIALPDAPDRQYWQDAPSTTDRRRRLFDAYVSARTAPGADPPPYSREQLFRWLRELATMLKRQGESEFLIERMQPEWLRSPVQRWAYRAGVLIVSASVVALAMQSSVAMSAWMPRGHIGPALESSSEVFAVKHALQRPLLLVIAIALGALIASRKKIVPVETLTWSWSRATGSTLRWARTAALAGLDYGAAVGVAGTLIWEVSTFAMSGNASAWQRAGEVAGLAAGASAAVFLAFIKPSGWIGSNRRAISGRIVVALAASGIYGVITAWTLLWAVDVRAIVAFTVTVLAVTAAAFAIPFSIPLDHRFRVRLLNALWAGVTGGAVIGAFSGVALSPSVSFIPWLNVWLTGGLAGGTAVGIAIGLLPRARDWLQKTKTGDAADVQRSWKRTAAAALPIAVSLGVAAMVSVRLGHEQAVRNVAHFMVTFGMGFLMPLAFAFLTAIACALSGAVTAGILGALAGALGGGAAGADVERRLVPNQGIRQSARNVVIFGALGALIVGLPYGLLNLSVAAAFTRSIPTGADVLGLGVAPGLTLGILAGLLPGAACIQHFVLRLMLWASGTLPLRAVGFLNFATRRRLLQRVGGRYRFIHVLLRDHLGERSPARTVA